jgi:hypothetical protein
MYFMLQHLSYMTAGEEMSFGLENWSESLKDLWQFLYFDTSPLYPASLPKFKFQQNVE